MSSEDGLSSSMAWASYGNKPNGKHGYSVSAAGDVNADGFVDVIVGAHKHVNSGLGDAGRVRVYHGKGQGVPLTYAWQFFGGQADEQFGASVSTAGDFDGDGFSDVVIGAPLHDSAKNNAGRASAFFGSGLGLGSAPLTIVGQSASEQLGSAVSSAGDVNGDGFSDLLLGAPGWEDDKADEGRAYVHHGNSQRTAAAADWVNGSDKLKAEFGFSVSRAGDVNGDGYSDVIIGAPYQQDSGLEYGVVFLYLGSSSGLSLTESWSKRGPNADMEFSYSVAAAGDVNGDGLGDLLIGAPGFAQSGESDRGRVYLHLGNAGGVTNNNQ